MLGRLVTVLVVVGLSVGTIYFVMGGNAQDDLYSGGERYEPTALDAVSQNTNLYDDIAPIDYVSHYEKEGLYEIYVSEDGLSQDECTQLEKYDPMLTVCFFTCSAPAECAQIQRNIDAVLDEWEGDFAFDDQHIHDEAKNTDVDRELVRYRVVPTEILVYKNGNDAVDYRELWQQVATLSRNTLSNQFIGEFSIYDDEESDAIAYVELLGGTSKWSLSVNLAMTRGEQEHENMMTYIHELAHIETLNASQVDPLVAPENCTYFFTGEGCAREDSYINAFVTRFWPADDIDQVDHIAETEGGNPVYTANPEHFVNDYAATNPGEDIAESFAYFVIKGKRDNADTVAQEKINFFYEYPELVALRQDMRRALQKPRSYVQR